MRRRSNILNVSGSPRFQTEPSNRWVRRFISNEWVLLSVEMLERRIFLSAEGGPIFVTSFNPDPPGHGVYDYTVSGKTLDAPLISGAIAGPPSDGETGFSFPLGIALSGSDLYVTAQRGFTITGPFNIPTDIGGVIGEYTTSGSSVDRALVSGLSNPLGIAASGADLFVFECNITSNSATPTWWVGEYTTDGDVVNPMLVSGTGPSTGGIAISGSYLFVAHGTTVGEYTTSGATLNDSLITVPGEVYGIAVSDSDIFVTGVSPLQPGQTYGFGGNGFVAKYTTAGAAVRVPLISGLQFPEGISIAGPDIFVADVTGSDVVEYTVAGAKVKAPLISVVEPYGLAVIPFNGMNLTDVDESGVAPTLAPALNLSQVFGGEEITVPVDVENNATLPVNGTLTLSLSTNPNSKGSILNAVSVKVTDSGSASATAAESGQTIITLDGNEDASFSVTCTVPMGGLKAGERYYIVATLQESTASAGAGVSPSVLATMDPFEFVGTPGKYFDASDYFEDIGDLVQTPQQLAIADKDRSSNPSADYNNAQSFIYAWEGNKLYPYMDSQNVPSIGVGINLKSLRIGGTVTNALVADVTSFLGGTISGMTPTNIIKMLIDNATANGQKGIGVPFIAATQSTALFATALANVTNKPETNEYARILSGNPDAYIAIEDMIYNLGTLNPTKDSDGFKNMVIALKSSKGPDLIRAGFEMVNSKRREQLVNRTEGDFQELFLAIDPLDPTTPLWSMLLLPGA